MNKTQQLIAFATENYEAGGHWIVECWDAADYNQILEENSGDVELAKEALQRQWELTLEQERNCAWGAPDEAADDDYTVTGCDPAEYQDDMDGDFDSAMASAGWGTDEDYGYAEDVY